MENEETETQSTNGDHDKRGLPKMPEIVKQANDVAERMENANQVRAELLAREEDIEARKILSGRSEAGQNPLPPVELDDKEYAEKAISGEFNAKK